MKAGRTLKESVIRLNMIVLKTYKVKAVGLLGICRTIRKAIRVVLMSFTMIRIKKNLESYSANVEKSIFTPKKKGEYLNTLVIMEQWPYSVGEIEDYTTRFYN